MYNDDEKSMIVSLRLSTKQLAQLHESYNNEDDSNIALLLEEIFKSVDYKTKRLEELISDYKKVNNNVITQ